MKAQPAPVFDPQFFLTRTGAGRSILEFSKDEVIFAQGDPADSVFYLQKGTVKLVVVSDFGKEAVVAIVRPKTFFGEGSLAGQSVRMATAAALSTSSVLRLEKSAIVRVIHDEPSFSELFISYLLSRNMRVEEDLVDQLFNSSEKRLARILLLLANFGKEGRSELILPKVSQETLAEMVGTTRSRVSSFMNKFRRLGFIHYNGGGLEVHTSLMNIVVNGSRDAEEKGPQRKRGAAR